MKAVMLSIQPKHCENICSYKKRTEVRKKMPKLDNPFKCYIYCTQGKLKDIGIIGETMYRKRMKVIGEFICDRIETFTFGYHVGYRIDPDELEQTCLTQDELMEYGRGDTLFGWHISNLVIYEQPKDLREFKPYNRTEEDCKFSHLGFAIPKCEDCHECYVKKPPQSYLFVEELKGETE